MKRAPWAFRFDEGHGYGVIRAGNRANALKLIKEAMYEDYPEDEHEDYVDHYEEKDIVESRYLECGDCNYITFCVDGSGCSECGQHCNRKGRIGYILNI